MNCEKMSTLDVWERAFADFAEFVHEPRQLGALQVVCRSNGWPANTAALRATNVRTTATLIICPVSLVGPWEAEIIKKLKDKKVSIYKYYGRNRKLSGSALSGYNFVLSTYETLGKDMSTYAPSACSDIRPPLLQLNWFRIIFDKSHRI